MTRRSFKGKRPEYSIATSVFVRKGKYKKGPSFGLWVSEDGGPFAKGSVKDDYLEQLAEFLNDAVEAEQSVSFALFKNKNKKRREEEDDDEDDEDEEDNEDEDEEEEEEKPSRRRTTKRKTSSRKSTKKSGKKSKWDFDEGDD